MKKLFAPVLVLAMFVSGSAFAQMPKPYVPPQGNAGATTGDGGVTGRVRSALATDPQLQGLVFTVETTNGVVTLTGVGTADQIKHAAVVTRGVEGVRGVINQLKTS
jgi:hyperosmotically inducible periplasmic protein